MPKRPCLRCGQLTATGSYCDAHRPQRGSRAWRGGSTRPWRGLRLRALQRDGFRCCKCGASSAQRSLEVHHLIPRSEGGADALGNLATLCSECHGGAHR